MTGGAEQQTARVNIGDENWREFRILATSPTVRSRSTWASSSATSSRDLDGAAARRSMWVLPQKTRPPAARGRRTSRDARSESPRFSS
jgi:hypothetical protein